MTMESFLESPSATVPDEGKVNLVEKVHSILVKKKAEIADEFLEMPYVKEAIGQPLRSQRILINRQLRMHLGAKNEDTSIARLALDDGCQLGEYLKNLKQYAAPQL